MSSSEGLERLKNWQKAEKALVVPSVSWKGSIRISEARAWVAFVDESKLLLARLDAPSETKELSLRGVAFGCTDESDLELTLVDGTKVYLHEED